MAGTAAEITASASDADGTNNAVTYSVTAQSCANAFAVGESTGIVTVADSTNLNYEVATDNECTVQITATSADTSTAATTFTVTLTDVDEADVSTPTDSDNDANTVAENSAATTTVGVTAAASDSDGTTNTITYAITAQSCSGVFAVHSSTGVVTVTDNTNLDYETAQSCTVTISATSADNSVASTTFTVAVTDVNIDITAGQAANIAEGSSSGTSVMTVTVTGDSDDNDFAITNGNTGTAFAIDASSGAITVAGSLDYETLTSYTLTISVSDGTNAATTETVAITVTDAAVTITNGQTANLAEDAANNAAVMTVETSGDSPTLFAITAGNGDGIFAISNAGAITVADNSNLNYEGGTTSYTLTIVATDTTTSDSDTVTISITDVDESDVTTPTDSDTDANTIAENSNAGTAAEITASATDADGTTNTVTYAITDQSCSNAFAVGESTGIVTVATPSALDYEAGTTCTLEVTATSADSSTAAETFTVTLTDVDESDATAPTDSNTGTNTVAENAANGATVGVTALSSDADGTTNTITYSATANSCEDDDEHGAFAVDSSTGVVTVNDNAALDYEVATSCTITVKATSADNSHASTTFTVAVTDFDESDVTNPTDSDNDANTVAEDAANGAATQVTASASDADGSNNAITYSVTAQSCSGAFAVDSSTGVVTATGSGLDYETAQSCTVEITATSADTSTASTTFTIGVTDAVIDIAAASPTIAENAANGAAVVTLTSSGDDPTNAGFTIQSGNDNGAFAVATGGAVTVADTTQIDFDTAASQTVVFTITDGSNAVTESVTITFTDVVIAITADQTGTVAENTATNNAIMTVATTGDTDGDDFAITAGNDDGLFAINAASGVISTTATALNYESATSHTLTISVSDGTNANTVTRDVTISVTDVDEFDAAAPADSNNDANTVAENAANGATVGLTASTSDADGSNNAITYAITTQSCSGAFAVDSSSGVVTATGSGLDYETATSCTVTISGTSADGSGTTTQFTIAVTDVVIDIAAASPTIAENAANGAAVVTLTSSGDDATNAGFTIQSGNDNGAFAVATGGAVTVADTTQIDFDTAASQTVVFTITDGSNAVTESVTITFTDVVIAITADQTGTVAENTATNNAIMTVATTGDTDGDDFAITAGNDDGLFAINAASGVISTTATALNYESATSHTLTISVSDGTNANTVTRDVTISVTDVDEFDAAAPADSNNDANTVAENAANGATVGLTASTSDADGSNNAITYAITTQSCSGAFAVDSSSGVVTATGSGLDYETATSCTVTISGTSADGSGTTTQFTIAVTNVNEAPNVASAIADASTNEDSAYSLSVTSNFADVDGDSLTYSATGLPSSGNLAMSSSGTLSGTPTQTDVDAHTIVVTATDGSLSVSDTFILTIANVNDAPSASAGSDQTPTEGATVTLDASGSSDEDGDSMTYAWSQDSGTTMSLSSTSSATPTFTAPEATANYALVFTVTVTDGNGGSDTDSVTITVSADNDAPSITSTAVTSATEDAAYSYTVTTSDPESQAVTVTCTTCPSWLSYSSSTGKLTGTPDNDDVGANAVVLSATDQTTAVTQSFTVTVANVNSIGSVSLSGTTAEDSTNSYCK